MMPVAVEAKMTPIAVSQFDMGPWTALASAIRDFDADVIVLVARKMPRLVEVLQLDLGANTTCVSDQAIPFVHKALKGARVAIVDDIWNVGTTMTHALERVKGAGARTVRLFALGARDVTVARNAGVHLAITSSLTSDLRRALVEAVPKALVLSAKPYDMDFPVIPCVLRAPFSSWSDCWNWLHSQFGNAVHATVDDTQVVAGFARATVDIGAEAGWAVKSRLYFDFNNHVCNLVPMALGPSLPLANIYPKGTLSETVFRALEGTLTEVDAKLAVGRGDRDGLASFCLERREGHGLSGVFEDINRAFC